MKHEIIYDSADKKTKIAAVKWECEGQPKAILQISHGMCEHIQRYDDFAKYLNNHGIMVVGNDHLGHGKSVNSNENLGYFCKEKGHYIVVNDLKEMRDIIKIDYPDTPYFLLGHSMGSFMARQYIETYGDSISGAIIMGTGIQSQISLAFAKLLCKIQANKHGWHYRSNSINNIAFGKYNKRIKNKTNYDWLTKDNEVVKKYIEDPLCGYTFTLNGFYNLFSVISYIQKPENVAKIPKDLPIFIVSGEEDPVGNYSKAVYKLYDTYKRAHIRSVQKRIYEFDRHEILNETDKEQVYEDILNWIENQL